MKKFKAVLVANDDHPIEPWLEQKLGTEGIDFSIHICWDKHDLARYAGDADFAWLYSGRHGLMTEENLKVLTSCKVIFKNGSGVDNIDAEAATRLGIVVAHTPDSVTESVSDHVIGLLFSAVRQISHQDHLVREGIWDVKRGFPGRRFHSATLGLVGFGRVGRMVAHKLAGFEMKIICYDPYVSTGFFEDYGVQPVGLEDLLKSSDFVSLHCPLTQATHHLIGEAELKLMKPEAILVNVSRGSVVDEKALQRALQEGWIAGAALDVMEKEPPNSDNPLLRLDNVVLTPHTAGYSDLYPSGNLEDAFQMISESARGQWPRWVVNPEVKPRWRGKG